MYHHIKQLMYSVRVGVPDPRFGNMLLEQFGGANGELAAAMQNGPNQFRAGPGGGPGPNGGADPMTGGFLKRYDQNGDGKLSLQEIPASMRRSFQAKDDLDSDGQISPAELQAVMARMGGGARAWAAGVDPNRNQRIPPRGKP